MLLRSRFRCALFTRIQLREGFSLVELLVSVVLFSVVIASAAAALTAHIRSSSNLEFIQLIRNDLSRLAFLLETEVREGSEITIGQTVDCAGGGTSLFTITVPQLGGTGASLAPHSIHYYATGSGNTASLVRCGPPINNNGSLDFGGTRSASTVSTNTTLTVSGSSATSVSYTITVWDPAASRSVTSPTITNRVASTLIL